MIPNPVLWAGFVVNLCHINTSQRGIVLTKRTNYKQEKRLKELEKQKKKEAKKEKKANRDTTVQPDVESNEEALS